MKTATSSNIFAVTLKLQFLLQKEINASLIPQPSLIIKGYPVAGKLIT
jgi:hypothetical protein